MTTFERAAPKFGRALVIGGSIGGLAAARALADHFEQVTVVEREARPANSAPRKCVPQGSHTHLLLELGSQTVRRWFPGIVEEMVTNGAYTLDPLADTALYHYGGWKPRQRSDIETLSCTRPFLEWHVRKHVEALPNVEFIYGHTAQTLLWNTPKDHITGVHINGPSGERDVYANLVVDAAGRGTRVPRWLEEHGFGRPEEETVEVDLAYTSTLLELPADYDVGCRFIAVWSRIPNRRGGFLYEAENKRWLISLTGYFGDHASTEEKEFRAFAQSLPVPDLHRALEAGKIISNITQHKIPSSRWNRYDKLRRFPEGLVAIADSVTALNPVYGQGMSVAVRGAVELETNLAKLRAGGRDLRGFARKFQDKLARIVEIPWLLSTTLDLRHPEARGRRPPGSKALQWAFQNVCDVSSIDSKASRIFMEILQMRRGVEGLAHPDLLLPLVEYLAKSSFTPLETLLNAGPMPQRP